MSKNEILKKTSKPFIFTNKLNNNLKIIPLRKTINTLGSMTYFPPTNQEWSNSVYAYNNIYTKNITIADKSLSRLIKSYFNLYWSKKVLQGKRILTRFRRISLNRVLVSKAELKHTSTKVTITLYVYNEERRTLLYKLKRIEAILFPSLKFISNEVKKDNNMLLSNKLNILFKEEATFSFIKWLELVNKNILEEIKSEKKSMDSINKSKLRANKIMLIKNLEEDVKKTLLVAAIYKKNPSSLKNYEDIYYKLLSKILMEKEISSIIYYKLLLRLNKSKFEDLFLSRLKVFISKIYKKEVEFNIVNLKAIYLNSDIFTQAIALKLQNRDNRLLKVLRYFLYMVKLPRVNFFKERFAHIDVKSLWENKVKNLTLKPLTSNILKDNINQLLTSLFTSSKFLGISAEKEVNKENNLKSTSNILNHVLKSLKHKNMAGVRLEAKGRLTRRFTASRSVFKVKWKGSLKNIESSYRGLSSVILRGHLKSNVQYSIVNYKTRNGAFGLKGWISGK